MIVIYKYIYVKSKIRSMFSESDYKQLIDQYSQEGWRFVGIIPTVFGGYGQMKEMDLVFEKQE